MNTMVRSNNTDWEGVVGQHGCGTINDSGERLVDFSLSNNCMISGTLFPHQDIHKLSWRSPEAHTVNHIDHVIINNKWLKIYAGY